MYQQVYPHPKHGDLTDGSIHRLKYPVQGFPASKKTAKRKINKKRFSTLLPLIFEGNSTLMKKCVPYLIFISLF